MTRFRLAVFATLTIVLLSTGCRSAECRQMMECCAAAEDDLDGVGAACGGLADDTRDPQVCRDVVRTIGYMYEDQDRSLPSACQSP